MSLIRLQNACIAFGHVALLDNVELNVKAKERVCLVGRNGTGKSTLLRALQAQQPLDSGTLWQRQGLSVACLAQEVPDAEAGTLYSTVAAGLGSHGQLLSNYHAAADSLAAEPNSDAALRKFDNAQQAVEQAGAWDSSQHVDAIISRLQLPKDAMMSQCSGGVRRRAMLAQALVSEPELLLLDEPTNHLDIDAIDALEKAVLDYAGAVVFITHDRRFIDAVATRIVELDRGELRSYEGNYAYYKRHKAEELAAQESAAAKFDKNLAQEEVWIRQGIKARRTRNEGRVRQLESLRRERAARRSQQGKVKLKVDGGSASGKRVIETENLGFAFPDQPIVKDFNLLLQRGDRIGLVGANGSGKSTLLSLLLKHIDPQQGTVEHGTGLKIGYFDQEREQLNLEQTVRDNVSEGSDQITLGDKTKHVVSYLGDFLFSPARCASPVKTLSGGERNRLLLAKLFTKPTNLLVLDEPTNDLDVETLELLEELLLDYQGTLLLVSHDRSFLDSTVTSTLVLSGNAKVEEFVGGYSDWQRAIANSATNSQQAATNSAGQNCSNSNTNAGGSTNKSNPKSKRSYKIQRELDTLPRQIEAYETQQAQLQQQISEPAFYQQDQTQVAKTLAELATLEQALASAYARWEELEG